MKNFLTTLLAGLILMGIATIAYPTVKREYNIREFAKKHHVSVEDARWVTSNGENLDNTLYDKMERARRGY